MKKFVAFLLLPLFMSLAAIGSAQQDKKAELVQLLRSVSNDNYDAEIVSRFVTIDASPDWWNRLLDPAGKNSGPLSTMANVGTTLARVANNLGMGDADTLNRNSGLDGNSPPLLAMFDSWKGKISMHIVMDFKPDEHAATTTIENLDRTLEPFSNTDDCKPRGGKFFADLRVDPKATKYTVKVSKDGNNYDVVIPAYTDLSQPYFRESLHVGK